MPNFGADNFEEIRKNMERIKKEENINGVDTSNQQNTTQNPDPGYPQLTPAQSSYMGLSSDPTQTEAFKRYHKHPVGGVSGVEVVYHPGKIWRDYLLYPIKSFTHIIE